ncbi:hypothetical protein JX265_009688 [Neoarthrinium moseri]|uniref:Uncharacterized protein n=1 Tax=Neoarthrinium moseri TaxID=1658444 RepID=A0A9P9WFR9_9PEZI|nr:hypothetical protein JX265_009688 [Neoarthrinium moseri]
MVPWRDTTGSPSTGRTFTINGSDRALQDLVEALGYDFSRDRELASPYIASILSHWPGREPRMAYVDLLVQVIKLFSGTSGVGGGNTVSVQECIDHFIDSDHEYFKDGLPAGQVRTRTVTSSILIVLGSWTLMPRYFTPLPRGDQHRHIVSAYCKSRNINYDEIIAFKLPLPRLMEESCLLPNPSESGPLVRPFIAPASHEVQEFELHRMDEIESLSIDARDLNLYKLVALGGVRIKWTDDICRHLLLVNQGGLTYLEIFAIPCAIHGGAEYVLEKGGIPAELAQDIKASYANLFNPVRLSRIHRIMKPILAMGYWCWCLSCSSRRLKTREFRKLQANHNDSSSPRNRASTPPYDPLLSILAEAKAVPWDPTEFPNLWPRLLSLHEHMNRSRPWNFWVLFRDNRDTLQYWTFLFGTLILILTILQVFLSIAQVVGSFKGD